jgi:hypothetical protein
MTKLDLNNALKELKNINKIKLNKTHYTIKDNIVRYEYPNQEIILENYTLIFSATIEQTHSINYSSERVMLAVALLDKSNRDLYFKRNQLRPIKELLTQKLLTNV